MEYNDTQHPQTRASSRLRNGVMYVDGAVFTPDGIVSVYSEIEYTRLGFVFAGTYYARSFKIGYAKRYLITLANRFAKEITTAHHKNELESN